MMSVQISYIDGEILKSMTCKDAVKVTVVDHRTGKVYVNECITTLGE